jgi:hypothetical protein
MEQYIAQNPALALVLLVGAWELVRFLGGKGWDWISGVADKSVTKKDCGTCKKEIVADLRMGDDLFLLLLEGQSLQTDAILAMCNPEDEDCKEIVRGLKEHNRKLVTHRERRHAHA